MWQECPRLPKGSKAIIIINQEMMDWLEECCGAGAPEHAYKTLHGLEVIVGEYSPNCTIAYFPAHYEVHDVDTGEMLNTFIKPTAIIPAAPAYVCYECKRDMSDGERGDEFPEERCCDQCAGIV